MNYANYSLKNLEAQLDHVCDHAVRRNQKTEKSTMK